MRDLLIKSFCGCSGVQGGRAIAAPTNLSWLFGIVYFTNDE